MTIMKDRISGLTKLIRTLTLFWGYFTVLSLFAFGFSFLLDKNTLFFGIIVFVVGILYAILMTALYVLGPKKNNESKKKKSKKKLLKFFYNVVKVFVIILPLVTLTSNLAFDIEIPKITTVLSLVWLVLTIGIEITLFVLKRTLNLLGSQIKKIVSDKDK